MQVTKTFLPPLENYVQLLQEVWQNGWITNNGPLLQRLERHLQQYLQVPQLLVCNNGTVVLQMALKALGITGEVITTPFSYVATTNALLWEGCTPVFVDIDPHNFCIDSGLIEAAITPRTQAILATHVYGFACQVAAIEAIAQKHGLKVLYDGAHAFGVELGGRSLLSYGDVSTCSFHATKLFHMAEGGCITSPHAAVMEQLMLYRQFGHVYDEYKSMGINAKSSELHAAMGLAVWPYLPQIIASRKQAVAAYLVHLPPGLVPPVLVQAAASGGWNYGYMPLQFSTHSAMLAAKEALTSQGIYPRRYFWPALHQLPFLPTPPSLPVAEQAAQTVLCLPLYEGMEESVIQSICNIIAQAI